MDQGVDQADGPSRSTHALDPDKGLVQDYDLKHVAQMRVAITNVFEVSSFCSR